MCEQEWKALKKRIKSSPTWSKELVTDVLDCEDLSWGLLLKKKRNGKNALEWILDEKNEELFDGVLSWCDWVGLGWDLFNDLYNDETMHSLLTPKCKELIREYDGEVEWEDSDDEEEEEGESSA